MDNLISWDLECDEMAEGRFQGNIICGEDRDDLTIYIDGVASGRFEEMKEYAEKCAVFLNTIPNYMIDEICTGISESTKEVGLNKDFVMPELADVRGILDYCWMTTVYVAGAPDKDDEISFIVEGEGNWGEVIGFVILRGELYYVGVEYMEEALKNKEFKQVYE